MQFLAAAEEEAVEGAVQTEVEGVKTWVMPAEYLAAIALKTGRLKDHNRILQFLDQDVVDRTALAAIVERHDLGEKWELFKGRYFGER